MCFQKQNRYNLIKTFYPPHCAYQTVVLYQIAIVSKCICPLAFYEKTSKLVNIISTLRKEDTLTSQWCRTIILWPIDFAVSLFTLDPVITSLTSLNLVIFAYPPTSQWHLDNIRSAFLTNLSYKCVCTQANCIQSLQNFGHPIDDITLVCF